MAANSKIEWTEATWNPVRGCTKISPGCKHCYAETFAQRFRGVVGHPYEQGFDLRLVPETLDEPLRRSKPTTYFVNSMSDIFHEGVPDYYVQSIFSVMEGAQRHTFQVLTKRAERMAKWVQDFDHWLQYAGGTTFAKKLPNAWLGVSVEDRKYGLPRVEHLRQTPAAIRFLSIEPLLEDLGEVNLTGIDWVIVGGESGPGARPMEADWARSLRNQCAAAGVAFFMKQMDKKQPIPADLFIREFPQIVNQAETTIPPLTVML